MKGYTERPSFIVEFENEQRLNRFKAFIGNENLYTAFQSGRSIYAIVDRKWEKKIYEFVNNQYQ